VAIIKISNQGYKYFLTVQNPVFVIQTVQAVFGKKSLVNNYEQAGRAIQTHLKIRIKEFKNMLTGWTTSLRCRKMHSLKVGPHLPEFTDVLKIIALIYRTGEDSNITQSLLNNIIQISVKK
jgi:ribosomal protein S17E